MGRAMGIGAWNGFFVTRLKIPSFLVTLGMLLVVRGTGALADERLSAADLDAGDQWLAEVLVGSFCIGGDGDFMHRRAAHLHEPDLVP